jgi:hypothetical protein
VVTLTAGLSAQNAGGTHKQRISKIGKNTDTSDICPGNVKLQPFIIFIGL